MKTEAVVQSEIRLVCGQRGIIIERNNVGATEDITGRIIRYGLGNDSAQLNRRFKSSDLVGTVAPHGRRLNVECKAEGWKFPDAWRGSTPDEVEKTRAPADAALRRTLAQWRWLKLHHDAGALAGFATSVADFERILTGELVLP